MTNYKKCAYVDSQDMQCPNSFFSENEDDILCPLHKNSENPKLAATNDPIKFKYLERINRTLKWCDSMTIEEVNEHIALKEAAIEIHKTELQAMRGSRSAKLDKLSEAERAELRKIKASKPPITSVAPKAVSKKAASTKAIKDDPIAYLMKSTGMSREDCMKMLED